MNDHLRLVGIRAITHRYEVNAYAPLGWFIDCYRVRVDKESRIVNDPEAWLPDGVKFIAGIYRIVYLSVETVRIIDHLSNALETWPNLRKPDFSDKFANIK